MMNICGNWKIWCRGSKSLLFSPSKVRAKLEQRGRQHWGRKSAMFSTTPAQVTGLDGQWQSKRVFREHGIVLKVQTIKILCLRAAFGFQNISVGPRIHVSGWRYQGCVLVVSSLSGRFDLIWCWDNNIVFREYTDRDWRRNGHWRKQCVCVCARGRL